MIGAGATGVSAALQLVDAGWSGSVTVVDPRPIGGVVWGDADPDVLANSGAALHSLFPDRPGEFTAYLHAQGLADQNDFPRRSHVGDYCRQRFRDYQELAARRGTTLEYVAARVTAIRTARAAGGHVIELADGRVLPASRVLVCTGFASPVVPDLVSDMVGHPALTATPYPTAALRAAVPARARVLVLGMGNSAIDAVRILCRDGHTVTMSSRTGELPAVRSRSGLHPDPVDLRRVRDLSIDDPLLRHKLARICIEAMRRVDRRPLRRQLSGETDPVRRLRDEVRLCQEGAAPWQDVTISLLEELYQWLPDQPQEAAEQLLAAHRDVLRRRLSAMSLPNARSLLTHLDRKELRISTRSVESVRHVTASWRITWADGEQESFHHVVCACGFNKPYLYHHGSRIHLENPPPGSLPVTSLAADQRVRVAGRALDIWIIGAGAHVRMRLNDFMRNNTLQARNVIAQLRIMRA